MFIHDSLSELVMCGETEVVAGDLRMKMMSLQNSVTGDTSGLTGFEKQFQVPGSYKVKNYFVFLSLR